MLIQDGRHARRLPSGPRMRRVPARAAELDATPYNSPTGCGALSAVHRLWPLLAPCAHLHPCEPCAGRTREQAPLSLAFGVQA